MERTMDYGYLSETESRIFSVAKCHENVEIQAQKFGLGLGYSTNSEITCIQSLRLATVYVPQAAETLEHLLQNCTNYETLRCTY